MLLSNPEFKKNIKLEFNITRFIVPIILLALIAWMSWNTTDGSNWEKLPIDYLKRESLFNFTIIFGFVFSLIWGTYLTINSLTNEIKQKTWDFIRMSSLPPYKVLLGKLFGAPSAVWAVTIAAIFPLMAITGTRLIPDTGLVRPEYWTIISLLFSVLCWMIISYTVPTTINLFLSRTNDPTTTIGIANIFPLLLNLILGFILYQGFQAEYSIHHYHIPQTAIGIPDAIKTADGLYYLRPPKTGDWYGWELLPLDKMALIFAYVAIWSVIGALRMIRSSLQYKDSPLVWLAFLLITPLFINGFGENISWDSKGPLYLIPVLILTMGWATTLPTSMIEATNKIRYQLIWDHIRNKKYTDCLRILPLWMISFAVMFIPLLLLPLGTPGLDSYSARVSLLIIYARDLTFFHAIAWKKSIRRPFLGMVVYLATIYGLIPAILKISTGKTMYDYMLSPYQPDVIDNPYPRLAINTGLLLLGLLLANRNRPSLKKS
jgi:hypothetical protein